MSNGVPKRSEFDASTRVMESDLLRVLTDQSSDGEGAQEPAAPRIEIVVAEPTKEEVATQAPPPSNVAVAQRPRGSRVFLVAAVVAAIVLAFDASLFVLHQRREVRPPAAPAAPEPLPRYMLLPLAPTAPTSTPTPTPPPLPAPATTAVVAAVVPTPTATTLVRSHRHSHHRHASH
jgi:hypothetical protein